MNGRAFGDAGERMAEAYLAARGAEILARNYRCRYGEIDLIARMDGVIAFVEVKRRSSGRYGSPAEAVTREKRRRITATAICYMRDRGLSDARVRMDVVAVAPDGSVRHIPAAFYPEYETN